MNIFLGEHYSGKLLLGDTQMTQNLEAWRMAQVETLKSWSLGPIMTKTESIAETVF